MKKQYSKKYLVWLFPAVVAGMIFLFSSQHAEESSHLSNIFVQILLQVREKLGVFPQVTDVSLLHLFSMLVRKGAHVTEYIILIRAEVVMTSAFYIKDVIIIESAAVTLDSKVLLNIKEASDLFEIGQHRLREIVREDYGNKYHLMLGRTIKIKRKQFEEFIDNVEQI